jgi:lipopolysaccharide export system protein LptC
VRRPLLISAALAGAAALIGLALWQLRARVPAPSTAGARSDYVLHDFDLVSLDAEGHESFSVAAPYLERDPGGRSLSLRKPEFSFPDRQEGRWLATSEKAWVAEKGLEIRLIEQVRFTGPASPRGERTRLATEHLQVFPKRDLALSQDPVTITRADSILQGTGLHADMKAHRIQLLSQVKGRYAPRRP